jgi:polysaccharide chain length determinant protein (PEP-CTERM system associated)
MAEEARTGVSLANVLAIWSRRKWLAIFAFAAVASATATAVLFLPKIYQSTATVLVVGQQVPTDFVRPTVTGTLDTRLQTINQEILSRSRLEELINRFDLYPHRNEVSADSLIERIRRDIEVKPTGTDRGGATIAFTVKYSGRDPQTVALVTNTLASYYIEENMKVRERQATGTAEFLKVQLSQVKGRLETQERHVSDFKRRYLGELPTQLEPNLATLERLNTQFRVNAEKQMRAKEQRQEMARLIEQLNTIQPAAPTPSGGPRTSQVAHTPSAPDPNAVRLYRMKQDLKDMLTRYSPRYPDVIQLQSDIEALERQVQDAARERQAAEARAAEAKRQKDAADAAAKDKEQKPATRDPYVVQMEEALNQLQVEITTLKEEEAKLRADMAIYQQRVDNTPRRDLEFQELSRDYGSTRELYNTLLKRYEEAQLSENLEQRQKGEQFRILEPAVTATAPVAPNRPRLLLAGVGLALGLAVGLVILAEQLDTSFHSVDELRAITSFPVLVSIPRIVTEGDVRRSRWRAALVAAVAVCCLTLVVGASYFVTNGNENLLRLVSGRL